LLTIYLLFHSKLVGMVFLLKRNTERSKVSIMNNLPLVL
jgi:hypothetical protein